MMRTQALFLALAIWPVGTAMAHNHTPFHGGQVGMSGDIHVEFVAMPQGEYRLYVTDMQRRPVDVSRATGTLAVNPDGADSELLMLRFVSGDQPFFKAQGRPRQKDEMVLGSVSILIPGKEDIVIEFEEKIGTFRKFMQIRKFQEFGCARGHLFSIMPEKKICPFDGTCIKMQEMVRKVIVQKPLARNL